MYHSATMADDVRALLDHLNIERADVMGYSMGARITAFLVLSHAARVRSVIFGGLGIRLVEGVGLPESIADALEAPSPDDVRDPTGRMFRIFCRTDKIRLARAGRMYPRLASDLEHQSGGKHSRTSAGRRGPRIR